MGTFGEDCAKYQFTHEQQDKFIRHDERPACADAINSRSIQGRDHPVTFSTRKGEVTVEQDEGPLKIRLDKIPTLKPAFKKDGTITAAASSSINDGAAALVLMRQSTAQELGCKPWPRSSPTPRMPKSLVVHHRPVGATQKALKKAGWSVQDVACGKSTKPSPSCPWPRWPT